jgi:hypothetical protein
MLRNFGEVAQSWAYPHWQSPPPRVVRNDPARHNYHLNPQGFRDSRGSKRNGSDFPSLVSSFGTGACWDVPRGKTERLRCNFPSIAGCKSHAKAEAMAPGGRRSAESSTMNRGRSRIAGALERHVYPPYRTRKRSCLTLFIWQASLLYCRTSKR